MSKASQRIDILLEDAAGLLTGGTKNVPLDVETSDHLEKYNQFLTLIKHEAGSSQKSDIINSFREIIKVRERVRIEGMISVDQRVKEHLEIISGRPISGEVLIRQKLFEEVVDKATADIAEIFEESVLGNIITENSELQAKLEELQRALSAKDAGGELADKNASVSEMLLSEQDATGRLRLLLTKEKYFSVLLIGGLLSTSISFASHYDRFLVALNKILEVIGGALVPSAKSAESVADISSSLFRFGGMSKITQNDIILLIIFCLMVSYIISLFGLFVFKSKQKLDFCVDSLKGLTGFFIGVATGFFSGKA